MPPRPSRCGDCPALCRANSRAPKKAVCAPAAAATSALPVASMNALARTRPTPSGVATSTAVTAPFSVTAPTPIAPNITSTPASPHHFRSVSARR